MFTFPEKSMTDLGGGVDLGEGRTGSTLRTKDWQAGSCKAWEATGCGGSADQNSHGGAVRTISHPKRVSVLMGELPGTL